MRNFLSTWWKAIAGLIVGYTIGTLVIVQRPVNYEMVLKYLQAFISFPMALLLIFTVLIAVYKEEFRQLFAKMQGVKAAGFEATFMQAQAIAAAETERIIEEVVVADKEPERKEIDNLPSGPEREQRIRELEKETEELRIRLYEAVRPAPPQSIMDVNPIEGLRSIIQRVVSRELANVGFPHKRSYRRLRDHLIQERWALFRPTCIEKVKGYFPNLAEMYADVLPAAVDSAFNHYQHHTAPSLT